MRVVLFISSMDLVSLQCRAFEEACFIQKRLDYCTIALAILKGGEEKNSLN